jgi:type IX secretion system PorP/SprF family membrane protein
MRKPFLLTAIAIAMCLKSFSQDHTFSQFFEAPMLRNPSLAGVFTGDLRGSAIHRTQWGSVTVPFQTSALGVEYKLPVFSYNDFFTMGVQMTHDMAGDIAMKRTQFLPVINYHKSLSDDEDYYLSLAFSGGPVQSQFDPTKAKLDDQFVNGGYSPTNGTNQVFSKTGFTYWDASTGLTFSSGFGEYGHYYIGGALFHFNKPRVNYFSNNSDTRIQSKYVINAGITSPISDYNRLLGFADYFVQGGNRQFLGGLLYETDIVQYDEKDNIAFAVGGFYRWNDAFIPVVNLIYHEWKVGLSYDVNVSKLKTASQMRGGLELTASYRGFLNLRSSTAEKVRCVRF